MNNPLIYTDPSGHEQMTPEEWQAYLAMGQYIYSLYEVWPQMGGSLAHEMGFMDPVPDYVDPWNLGFEDFNALNSIPLGGGAGIGGAGGASAAEFKETPITGGTDKNRQKRRKIDEIARSYDGRTEWAYSVEKDDFKAKSNKCNKFVYDVTNEAGAKARAYNRIPQAGDWAENYKPRIKNWTPLTVNETPEPGDVIAYPLAGGGTSFSGHVGFIVSDGKGGVTNISAHSDSVYSDPKQFINEPGLLIRRYRGE